MSTVAAPTDAEELRRRLRSYVVHNAESERKSLLESFALTISERVEAGNCQDKLQLVSSNLSSGSLRLSCLEFHAKFREGDPLYLGDQEEAESGLPVQFRNYDPQSHEVCVQLDRFESGDPSILELGAVYRLDRRGLGLDRLLLEGLDAVFRPSNTHCIESLLGKASSATDPTRHAMGEKLALSLGFTESQTRALASMVSVEGVTLIQGPPGSGKTRLLAEAALCLAQQRCRIFVSAFTHRAIDNVLLAIRERSREIPIFKIGRPPFAEELVKARVTACHSLERMRFPHGGCVVGATPFAARRYRRKKDFHFVFLDEAGQLPVVHAAIAMTQARRHVIVGDPMQLPPVRKKQSEDPFLDKSIYAFLEPFYPSTLLDQSFRMNTALTEFISQEFYQGRLVASELSRNRKLSLREGGPLRELLDPEKPLLLARIDHRGRTRRSHEEVKLVVDLVASLRNYHAIEPSEIAVIAPFRAQLRLIRHELARRQLLSSDLVIDTVERMQGQEREVVIFSLVSSDRDYLEAQSAFYFEAGRLNVSLSRARSKCIVIGSRHAFRARPHDLPDLVASAHFKRMGRCLPMVDLTDLYGGESARV